MASVNRVIVVGNLGRDPQARYTADGDCICHLNVATSEKWRDKETGEKKELTEWHRIVLYRKLGETAVQYLKKGAQVYIEGRLQTRKWADKDGRDRYTTEIVADHMQMLGGGHHDHEHDEAGINDGSDDAASYIDTARHPQQVTPASRGSAAADQTRQPQKNPRQYTDEMPF